MANNRTDTQSVINLVINGKQAMTSLKELTDTQRKLNSTIRNMKPGDPGYDKQRRELQMVNRALDEQRRKIRGVNDEAQNLRTSWRDIAGGIVGANVFEDVVSWAKEAIFKIKDAYAEYAKFRAVLTVAFKGNQDFADQSLGMLSKFAANTPFQLRESTEGFISLVNRGFVPAQKELIKLGDLAASQGKSLQQYIEAILDAQTGEFERLKEFGIRGSKSGNDVTLAFKGVTKEVKFTEKAIRDVLLSFGDMEGVAGTMKKVSEELVGIEANNEDTLDQIYTGIGRKSENFIKGFYRSYGNLLTWIKKSFIDTNLSETMEKERFELVKTELQIKSSNTTQAERVRLINKLKEQYPDYFKNIKAEKGYTEELVTVFKKLNNEYLNRIILQKKNEDFEAAEGTRAETMTELIDQEVKIREKLARLHDKYPNMKLVGKDDYTQLKNMNAEYNKMMNSQGRVAGGVFDPFYGVGTLLNKYNALNDRLKQQTSDSGKIIEDRQALAKRLGISLDEPIELKVVKNPITEQTDKGKTEVDKKAADLAKKLKEDLLKNAEDVYQNMLSKSDKEVRQVELKYKNLKDRAVNNKDQLLQIEQDQGNEMATLIRKQGEEEAEIRKKNADEAEQSAKEKGQKLAEQFIDNTNFVYQNTVTEAQKEIDIINDKYDVLFALAQQYGLDMMDLELSWAGEINQLEKNKSNKKIDELNLYKDAAIQAATQIADTSFAIAASKRQNETDVKLSNLAREREAELENKNLTENEKENINKKYDALENAERLRAWEANKKASIKQALINGALAATNIWATTPKVDFGVSTYIMLGLSALSTIASVAQISAQSPPEFASGVRNFKGGTALVGEGNGPELIKEKDKWWLTDGPTYANLASGADVYNASETSKMLKDSMYEKTNYTLNTSSARKAETNYRSNSTATNKPSANGVSSDVEELKDMVSDLTKLMADEVKKPVVFDYAVYEEYKKKIEYSRNQQIG